MNLTQAQVLVFHVAGNHLINDFPTLIDTKTIELRKELIKEELNELHAAMDQQDITAIADALGDLLYVIYGTAISYGLDMQNVNNEIHRSNMTKFDESGKSIKNKLGKTLKPSTYEPPNIKTALRQQLSLTLAARNLYPFLFNT